MVIEILKIVFINFIDWSEWVASPKNLKYDYLKKS